MHKLIVTDVYQTNIIMHKLDVLICRDGVDQKPLICMILVINVYLVQQLEHVLEINHVIKVHIVKI